MHSTLSKPITILIADDDPDDRLMAKDALRQTLQTDRIFFVEDGEELMDYLYGRGRFSNGAAPKPDLILLDLNMPRKTGAEALREIRQDPELRMIPIVVLTTSKEDDDVYKSFDGGVNSFITKPVTYESLLSTMKILGKYWFEIVELPSVRAAS
ncbi:MAG TPA: response regulator [Oculatellaceae cyanobacterium]|jgi:two-component system response regulator